MRPITFRPAAAAPASTPARSASRRTATTCGAERGLAEFDVKHRFVASYIWELPFGRGRRFGNDWSRAHGPAARRLAGHRHPRPAERPGADGDARRVDACSTSAASGGRVRTWWAIPSCRRRERTVERWFNTDAFAAFSPAPQAFGNAGVGIMRGPGFANFDFTLAKNFADQRAALLPVPRPKSSTPSIARTSARRTSRATRADSARFCPPATRASSSSG